MRFGSFAGMCYRGLWRLWFVAVLVTLIMPGTREAHICAWRALLQLPGGQTTVTPGGYTYFTEQYCEQRKAAAGNSPDDYLFASCLTFMLEPFPPATVWAPDPLLPWAAIEIATRMVFAERVATTSSPAAPELQVDERIHTTRELVALARHTEPENGLLWLAEALALFASGQDEPALAALESALRLKWDDHGGEAASRKKRLLMAEGLPEFDAAMPRMMEGSRPMLSLPWHARQHLSRLLNCAVECGNDAAFVRLVGILRNLRDSLGPRCMVTTLGLVKQQEDLVKVMAASLGVALPPRDLSTMAVIEARLKADEEVWNSYLRLHAPSIGEEIIKEDLVRKAEQQRRRYAERPGELRAMYLLIGAEAVQKLVVLMIGVFLAWLVAGVLGWLWPPEWPDGKKLRLRRGFLLALVPAFALMVFCVWFVTRHLLDLESVCILVSSDPANRPFVTDAQAANAFSVGVAALPILVLLSGPSGRAFYRAGLRLVAYFYLSAVIGSAILRHETVAAVGVLAT